MTLIKQQSDIDKQEADEEELITFKEFLTAIKKNQHIADTILPRSLSIQEVIFTRPFEKEYKLQDKDLLDDFVFFRYEMNTIFKKNQFIGDYESPHFMFGYSPLSKIGGEKKKMEVYRPPGIINVSDKQKSNLNKDIWNATPSNKIYVRNKGIKKEKNQSLNPNKQSVKAGYKYKNVETKQENAQEVNLEDIYEEEKEEEYYEFYQKHREEENQQQLHKDTDIKGIIDNAQVYYTKTTEIGSQGGGQN